MTLSLSFAIGILTIGLAIKCGLFPFYFWMPDTYAYATPGTAAVMSSVVSKAYIFLLIKVYYLFASKDLEGLKFSLDWWSIPLAVIVGLAYWYIHEAVYKNLYLKNDK